MEQHPEPKHPDQDYDQVPIDFSFVLASSVHDMKNSLGMLLNTLGAMMEASPPRMPSRLNSFQHWSMRRRVLTVS
ncbi:hypothetical protein [Cellvibrio sp. PSBB023]|uniref:hypothetical protein n=1 Tax=Cellvibrio sp. PSBB023 TaxID=1945512 RepID=UPI001FEF91E9|nr:hypothetical protein [Cellvibrio sp. PSBB023]